MCYAHLASARYEHFVDGGFFGGGDIQQKGKLQNFGLASRHPPQFPPLVGHSDLPVRKTLMRVLGLLTVMILKGVSDSIFFQSNRFTVCKVKDEKEIINSLMVFNLLKIIHPFQGKKHLRSY